MKSKILLTITTFAMLFVFASESEAGWNWRRVRCSSGCGYTYQRVYVAPQVVQPQVTQKTETQTTVVNNLVGIPVPVTYNQPIQAQGSTVYGYSSVAQAYGQVDMGLLYNQAARLTDQAQQLAGQASSDFATLVQAEGQNRAEVARILAQGQSARQALEAAAGTSQQRQQVQQRTFAFRVTQTGDNVQIQQIQDGQQTGNFQLSGAQSSTAQGTAANVSDLLRNSCVSCHGNANTQGGLNLEGSISDAQQAAILARVTTDDLDKRMPRNSNGTAGQKLNVSELRLLFNAMGSQK
jgi:hypothetical protein